MSALISSPTIVRPILRSAVQGLLVGAVRGWLELESTVLDVEVPSQALAQPVEYLGPPPSARAGSDTTTWAARTGRPLVTVQTWRSCTPSTPGISQMCPRTRARSTFFGVASRSTSVASRSSLAVRGRIRAL